ncbi:hypothetical protein R4Z10_08745 [Niallia sp. XMNu-256]|uniref:hypothetical protein n=1 Tax=Niallia sp. XMNu-256 TaxID=3082444 RepID=UPI0030CF5703
MPHDNDKIKLTEHDIKLLAKAADTILIKDNGEHLVVEVKHHGGAIQRKKRNLKTEQTKEDNLEIRRAYSKLGI